MPIEDKILLELVEEQTKYFLEDASLEKKVDVLKRIQKRQKQLMKQKDKE